MIENAGPSDEHVEQTSLPTQKVVLELVKRSQDDQQRSNHASALETPTPVYVTGWRLRLLTLCCALCMFLVNIEVTIVGASLISITNDLRGFRQMSWVVTAYLITYASMLIIWTKLSDIFGRKQIIIVTMFVFVAFSGGCGAAQTTTQLIVNRAFQGIGAAGGVSMALVVAYEMASPDQYPCIAAQIGAAVALGSLVGPLIGGGVSENSTWRWIFLFNVPAGVATIVLLFICIPPNFPHQAHKSYVAPSLSERLSWNSLCRLDICGALLLLGGSLLLVTVLLEANNEFSWNSGIAISLFIVSAVMWILLLVNERIVTGDQWQAEPIFPWRFLSNRAWMGTLLISFFSGVPYNIIVINIPQRFQELYGTSAFEAGVHLVPFNFLIALGTVVANISAAKTRIPPIYFLFLGSTIQLIGLALFSTLPGDLHIPSVIYGWEVLSGFGIGIVFGILLLIPPQVVEQRDLGTFLTSAGIDSIYFQILFAKHTMTSPLPTAVSSGALLQFRVFGGALGIAIATTVMNSILTSRLTRTIGPERLAAVLQSTAAMREFPLEMQKSVLDAFAEGYNLQMKIMAGITGVQLMSVGMLWRKKQIKVVFKRNEE